MCSNDRFLPDTFSLISPYYKVFLEQLIIIFHFKKLRLLMKPDILSLSSQNLSLDQILNKSYAIYISTDCFYSSLVILLSINP
jgi:hypothetical protein